MVSVGWDLTILGRVVVEGIARSRHDLVSLPFPTSPARVADADRVHVGDGIAPLNQIFRTLKAIGFSGWLSVELFNKDYWAQDPLSLAKTALHKVKAAVHRAVG
jgi:sugar phosphate isomerase/epimerase